MCKSHIYICGASRIVYVHIAHLNEPMARGRERSTAMKPIAVCFLLALLCGCSVPSFVADAPPVPVTASTPDRFELPARFALVRTVYGVPQAASAKETESWTDLANRSKTLGSFATLVVGDGQYGRYSQVNTANLITIARKQRYNYLLMVMMSPHTGSADVSLMHVGSGGVMATARAVSTGGGQRGFWGGQIRNPARLARTTLKIAKATAPVIEDLLRGAAERQ